MPKYGKTSRYRTLKILVAEPFSIKQKLSFLFCKHFERLLFQGQLQFFYLNILVFQLVSSSTSEHSSRSTISDKKMETLNQLHFYCLLFVNTL